MQYFLGYQYFQRNPIGNKLKEYLQDTNCILLKEIVFCILLFHVRYGVYADENWREIILLIKHANTHQRKAILLQNMRLIIFH